jgi:hypothetical protein
VKTWKETGRKLGFPIGGANSCAATATNVTLYIWHLGNSEYIHDMFVLHHHLQQSSQHSEREWWSYQLTKWVLSYYYGFVTSPIMITHIFPQSPLGRPLSPKVRLLCVCKCKSIAKSKTDT